MTYSCSYSPGYHPELPNLPDSNPVEKLVEVDEYSFLTPTKNYDYDPG